MREVRERLISGQQALKSVPFLHCESELDMDDTPRLLSDFSVSTRHQYPRADKKKVSLPIRRELGTSAPYDFLYPTNVLQTPSHDPPTTTLPSDLAEQM